MCPLKGVGCPLKVSLPKRCQRVIVQPVILYYIMPFLPLVVHTSIEQLGTRSVDTISDTTKLAHVFMKRIPGDIASKMALTVPLLTVQTTFDLQCTMCGSFKGWGAWMTRKQDQCLHQFRPQRRREECWWMIQDGKVCVVMYVYVCVWKYILYV